MSRVSRTGTSGWAGAWGWSWFMAKPLRALAGARGWRMRAGALGGRDGGPRPRARRVAGRGAYDPRGGGGWGGGGGWRRPGRRWVAGGPPYARGWRQAGPARGPALQGRAGPVD